MRDPGLPIGPVDEQAVTVAVCTRNRPRLLRRALASILAQEAAVAEVLAVDNDPGQSARDAVSELGGVRYVSESRPGLDFARNRALSAAHGDIVVFLDDDAVARPGWAAALVETMTADPSVAACTGRVEALALDTPAQRLFEANGGFGRGDEEIRLPLHAGRRLHGLPAPLVAWAVSIGCGASLAVRRRSALDIGGFDEALDLGPELPGGGDLDLLWRLLEAGWTVVYQPAALALHEHRKELEDLARQLSGHQRALVAFLVKSLWRAPRGRRAGIGGFLAWRLIKPWLRLLRRAVGRDPLPVPLLGRMALASWSGLTAYGRARRTLERRRTIAASRT